MEQIVIDEKKTSNLENLPKEERWQTQPLNNVVWRHRDNLQPNGYNPNSVAPPELELLKTSIIADGWTQPIVIHQDFTIVDGFHRWTVSGHKEIYSLTDGYVPTVMLKNKDLAERMSATVRHNRARGTHGILKMADIVHNLLESGVSTEKIMDNMGMEDEEVLRLANRKGVKLRIEGKGFGESWVPG